MTTNRLFSRSFATLSTILTLATGFTLTFAPSTARAESAFSIFVDDSADPSFMDYTDDACTPSLTGDACAAPARAVREASGTVVRVPAAGVSAPSAPATNIIMKDGNVCDPIRHMGC